MDIAQTSRAPVAPTKPDIPAAGTSALNSDFETFLKMLTVQMQNQDPLNPVDSADFAVQLAQFSTVEQQVRTNDLLVSLGDRLGALGMGQLLGWVGMTARAEMPVAFDGTPVQVTLRTEPNATEARLVVKDSFGTTVQSSDAPLRGGSLEWAGVDDAGRPLPNGTYEITTESYAGDALLASSPVTQSARIVEARNTPDGTRLLLETGQEIAADQVIGLRKSE